MSREGADLSLSPGLVGRFAANLVRCRRAAGISQEELGFQAGVHRTGISLFERGRCTPRIDTLVKLAGALEVSPEELLEGITWSPGEVREGRFKGGDY